MADEGEGGGGSDIVFMRRRKSGRGRSLTDLNGGCVKK